ncbi:hypothetical protein MJJ09_14810 [Xanthomonas oryzae]|uniref:hypothetical protein n=1 Tax=Xanthomonas oryzae TaxID=347 RepID=UPI0023AFE8AC|nr:hypothetical protein [Xanthomonas oryzae]WEE88567.1 hypothetical protein MJJ06_03300 [Xanthomonas oryzae]WEE92350.1 hypothetical protein MJJ09_14810 [Xanthomonas oryzae]
MDSLAAIGGEALGLQVIERAAARALDLDFIEGAGLAQQAGAFATTEALEHCVVLRWERITRLLAASRG